MGADARRFRRAGVVYGAVGVALWPVPVFGLLHAEAAAVFAGVGFFVAGLDAVRQFSEGQWLRTVLPGHLVLLAVPLALLTATLVWRPNCGYLLGLGLYLLLVPPSVILGVALAYALTGRPVRRPPTLLVATGIGVALGGVAWDLLGHPQLFTYSHVFGGVLGPLYDAELAVRPGLIAAKGQTLLGAAALLAVGHAWRGDGRRWGAVGAGAAALFALSYALAVPLGIQQSDEALQARLSQRVDLGRVVLHLDPATTPAEAARLADAVLYRYDQVEEALGVAPPTPVDVYLYPDPDTKAALIGSRTTSVVPVWLPTPQIHMLADEVTRSVGHEMVHVFAREFGVPILGASPAVGLVEGLAVALEPPDGLPDATALVAAGRRLGSDTEGLAEDPAAVVARVMGPAGFWTARAGVAYTASGSFVRWLLDRYGPGPVREAYRTGRFSNAFGAPLGDLAEAWAEEVAAQPVDPEAVAVAAWLFRRPSLFEVRCPHHTPRDVRWAREGDEALDAGRPAVALDAFGRAHALNPYNADALDGRQRARARQGLGPHPRALTDARRLADSLGDARALRLYADALQRAARRTDRPDTRAQHLYRAAADSLSPVDAVGRVWLAERARLPPSALARVLAVPPDHVPAEVERAAPFAAALHWASADRPVEAWRVARAWCVEEIAQGPDSSRHAEARAVLWLIQGQVAYPAGVLDVAGRLLERAGAGLDAAGRRGLARLARDGVGRVGWRAHAEDQTAAANRSILARPSPAPDALRPACRPVARTPDGALGVRAP